jgi:hypothetical protein
LRFLREKFVYILRQKLRTSSKLPVVSDQCQYHLAPWVTRLALADYNVESIFIKADFASRVDMKPMKSKEDTTMPDQIARKRLKKRMLDRWENEGGRIATDTSSTDATSEDKGDGRKQSSPSDKPMVGAPVSPTKRRKPTGK